MPTGPGAALPPVTCLGGAVEDLLLHLHAVPVPGTSNPAAAATGSGGVARNVAANLARAEVPVALVSRVGDDAAGQRLSAELSDLGVDVAGVLTVPGAATARYVAVLAPDGELVLGVADLAVVEAMEPTVLQQFWPGSGWVFVDCNLRAGTVAEAVRLALAHGTPLAVDAVSVAKAARLPARLDGVSVWFGNLDEARAYLAVPGHDLDGHDLDAHEADRQDAEGRGFEGRGHDGVAHAEAAQIAARVRAAGAAAVVLTQGAGPVMVADGDGVRQLPVSPAPGGVVDVTGAGDALVAGTLAALRSGAALDAAVWAGIGAAAAAVSRKGS